MQAQPIGKIIQRFKDEWLLIRVIDFDRSRTLPLSGQVLAHGKDRDEIHKKGQKYKKDLTLFMHSNERFPKGYGALF